MPTGGCTFFFRLLFTATTTITTITAARATAQQMTRMRFSRTQSITEACASGSSITSVGSVTPVGTVGMAAGTVVRSTATESSHRVSPSS